MNANIIQAREFVARAREALRRGDTPLARQLGEQAALLAPDMEDAWLILTASDSNPEDALAYAKKALELNPQSPRARKGVEWAEGKLNQAQGSHERVLSRIAVHNQPVAMRQNEAIAVPVRLKSTLVDAPVAKPNQKSRLLVYGGVLGLLTCVVLVFAAWSAVASPAFASIVDAPPVATQENLWAQVDVPKPSVTAISASAFAQAPNTPTLSSILPTTTSAPTSTPTNVPTSVPTEAPTLTPVATETPGVMALDILADTPTSEYIPPTNAPPAVASGSSDRGGVRWIDVDLTNQMVYAYEGDTVVNSFLVSTGTRSTPTVTGKYKIWIKLKKTNMSGPGYYLADVPYVMYFYKGYGLHGTYWHNNFGTPMSHGCVNLRIPDAEWLYYWASEGTVVNVHY